MRKSALIKELDEIVEKNGILFTKCRELETAINEKDALILELESKIELLTAENEQLKNTAFFHIIFPRVFLRIHRFCNV